MLVLIIWFIKLCCASHGMTCWFGIVLVHIWQEISLFHFLMELVLAIRETGSFFCMVPFFRPLAISVSPPLGHGAWLIYLSSHSHWVTLRLRVSMIHIRKEVALLHLLVEFILTITESGGLLNVIPLL